MKSDALFYELFQSAPQIFFELLQIMPSCPYRFESLTVKTSEKRIDGILQPEQEGQTIYFLEVQAAPDRTIYYRAIREVSTYFEQRPAQIDTDWQAVVLWLDSADDPGVGTLSALAAEPSPRLIPVDLLNLLKQLDDKALALSVLRPFTVDNETQVRQNLLTWVENIKHTPNLPPKVEQRLLTLMAQLIEQKFRTLSYKELSKMLQLTPLEETESVREVIHEDRIEMLMQQIEAKFKFSERTMEKLTLNLRKLALKDLEALFRNILSMKSLKELNAWIAERLPETEQIVP
jgi:predicted transposase YdaD